VVERQFAWRDNIARGRAGGSVSSSSVALHALVVGSATDGLVVLVRDVNQANKQIFGRLD